MPLNLQPRWIAPGDNVSRYRPPAIFRDALFFTTESECRAISLETGQEIWHFSLGGLGRGNVIIADGVAYFASSHFDSNSGVQNTFIHAVDAPSGAKRWTAALPGISGSTSLQLHGGRLLIGSGNFRELSPSDGALLRSFDIPGGPLLHPFAEQTWLVVNDYPNDTTVFRTLSFQDDSLPTVFTFGRRLSKHAIHGRRLFGFTRLAQSGATEVVAIDIDQWTVVWTRQFSQRCQSLYVGEEGVVLALVDDFLRPVTFAFAEADTGAVRWSHTAGDNPANYGIFTRGLFLTQTGILETGPTNHVPPLHTIVTIGLDLATGQRKFQVEGGKLGVTSWIVDTGKIVATKHGDVLGLDIERFWRIDLPGAARGAPVVTDGKVLVGNSDGRFRAFALENGVFLWSSVLTAPVEASPVVSGGIVFVGHAGGVSALRVSSGQILWSSATPKAVTSTLAVCGSLVVFGSRDRTVRAVAATDGAFGWSFETGGFVEGGAAFDGDTIFIGSDDGNLYAVGSDGALRWTFAGIGEIKSIPLLADGGLVIFGNAQGTLTALERASGVLIWQKSLPGALTTNTATLDGDYFWISDESGHVHRLAVTDGSAAWTTDLSLGPLRNKIARSGGVLFAGTLSGFVVVLDGATGAVLRKVPAYGPIFASPVAVSEAVIVATEAGQLQAYVP